MAVVVVVGLVGRSGTSEYGGHCRVYIHRVVGFGDLDSQLLYDSLLRRSLGFQLRYLNWCGRKIARGGGVEVGGGWPTQSLLTHLQSKRIAPLAVLLSGPCQRFGDIQLVTVIASSLFELRAPHKRLRRAIPFLF